jgi:hypothetical protein
MKNKKYYFLVILFLLVLLLQLTCMIFICYEIQQINETLNILTKAIEHLCEVIDKKAINQDTA